MNENIFPSLLPFRARPQPRKKGEVTKPHEKTASSPSRYFAEFRNLLLRLRLVDRPLSLSVVAYIAAVVFAQTLILQLLAIFAYTGYLGLIIYALVAWLAYEVVQYKRDQRKLRALKAA